MSDWLNKWCSIGISFILITTSFTLTAYYTVCSTEHVSCHSSSMGSSSQLDNMPPDDLSSDKQVLAADCIDIECRPQNDFEYSTAGEELVDDILSAINSYGTKPVQALHALIHAGKRVVKSGIRVVRKHPLKALTMFLALQSNDSLFNVPGAEALSVSNIDQFTNYVPDGPAVPLSRMVISPTNITALSAEPYSITFSSRDDAGILSSSSPGLKNGLLLYSWIASGSISEINSILSSLYFKPAMGYRSTIVVFTIISVSSSLTSSRDIASGRILIDPSVSEILVDNLVQTILYEASGLSVRLLPMTITSDISDFYLSISSEYFSFGNFTSPITDPALARGSGGGDSWYAQGNKSALNSLLANLYFKPSLTLYPSLIKVFPEIRDARISLIPKRRSGIFTIKPSSTFGTSSSASTKVVTSSSKITSNSTPSTPKITTLSSVMNSGSTTAAQSPPIGSSSVASSSLNSILAIDSSTSSSIPINMSPTISSKTETTSPSYFTQSILNPGDSSDTVTLPTSASDKGTTDPLSDTLIVPTKEALYGIIGGAVGGIVLCSCLLAGIVTYIQKKLSPTQLQELELPIQQPLPDANRPTESSHVSANYEILPQQSPVTVPYTALPISTIRHQNVNHAVDVVDQPQAPIKSTYSNLPTRNHYETSLPQNVKNYEELFSSLHKAAEDGDSYLIETILGFDIPVDSVNADGYTALHLAARAGHVDACNLLLDRGANKQLMTKDDKTALLLAKKMGHTRVINILE